MPCYVPDPLFVLQLGSLADTKVTPDKLIGRQFKGYLGT